MTICQATENDIPSWTRLKHSLWPHHPFEEHEKDARRTLSEPNEACFLLFEQSIGAVGFIECRVYPAQPESYCHIEGWYVEPQFRRLGWGRELVEAVELWSLHQAIPRLTSDTTPKYPISPAAHVKAGFKTLAQLTIFCKELDTAAHAEDKNGDAA